MYPEGERSIEFQSDQDFVLFFWIKGKDQIFEQHLQSIKTWLDDWI